MLVSKVSKNLLEELNYVINQLTNSDYSKPLHLLSGSTVGQHTRHILEFYQCFIEGNSAKEIDYDLRKRNIAIETDTDFASNLIDKINESIDQTTDSNIILKFNNGDECQFISSSIERELVYNIEHAIHHMAIIKIAIISNFSNVILPPNFGVAPSTVKYHRQNVHS
ncbi:MAG: DinB family protein [Bacteroidia bacterium]